VLGIAHETSATSPTSFAKLLKYPETFEGLQWLEDIPVKSIFITSP
jgi:hypothetical protein